ncbi:MULTISPECIES: AI-2E family transporter [Clostridium]|uniref:AI-2E family transporter n=1 Tax=Clostridium cibarium TaxID=2762247 RepID=A0ABR8PT83_9CLOT|nr:MULTISPECIES: AI-2E family transporter [Clostridium]MBD7911363.1 AI-2E family transporter [Clostridium cibarium]
MFFDRNIKYRDILIFALIGIVGYKVIDNYTFIFDLVGKFISIVSPFIYSLIFAYILNPIMKMFENRLRFKRGLSILVTYVSIFSIVVLLFIYVIPSILDSIISITSDIPTYVRMVQGWINEATKNENIYEIVKETGVLDYLSIITTKFGSLLVSALEGSLSSVLSITTNLVKIILGFLISIYVLLDKERFIEESKTITYILLKEERGQKLILWLKTYNKMIGMYVGTKALDSLIIGLIALIGLIVLKAPYTILIALVVGFTNMIPYFGPLIGVITGAIVGIFVSPSMAFFIALFLLALQQFDAWFLEPKLVGKSIGVRPFLIIVGVVVGGGFFGPVGMILASPTVATIKLFYEQKVAIFKAKNKNLMRRIQENNEEDPEKNNP